MKGFLKCFGRTILTSPLTKKRKQKQPLKALQTQGPEVDRPDHVGSPKHPIREFSWEEIERSTGSFSRSRVIGCGGFSTVYLGDIDAAVDHLSPPAAAGGRKTTTATAIKIIYGRRVFEEELKILRQLHHRNIVELIGYSRNDGDDQVGALVLEYISNGTLQEKLSISEEKGKLIPWNKRMEIAYQVAEALEYLHEKCGSLPVVHGDIKASNVLMDSNLNSRLCDFGSAKMGFSAAVAGVGRNERSVNNNNKRIMMGSPGYTDPHYLRTGIPSKKNDVYSFGVIVLHLLSGSQPFCPRTGQLLGPIQNIIAHLDDDTSDRDYLSLATSLVDPRLAAAGQFDGQEAAAMLRLSARCLRHPPSLRPSTTQILHTISSNCNTTRLPSLPSSSPPKSKHY